MMSLLRKSLKETRAYFSVRASRSSTIETRNDWRVLNDAAWNDRAQIFLLSLKSSIRYRHATMSNEPHHSRWLRKGPYPEHESPQKHRPCFCVEERKGISQEYSSIRMCLVCEVVLYLKMKTEVWSFLAMFLPISARRDTPHPMIKNWAELGSDTTVLRHGDVKCTWSAQIFR